MRMWMLSAPACRLFPTASLAFLGLLMACSDTTAPEEEPAIVSKAVIDGAHGGNAGFFFVPPLAQTPGGTGIFDASLVGRLTIEICAIQNGQCGVPAVTTFSATTGEPIVVDVAAERYAVTWRTDQYQITPGTDYRVRALIDGEELGYADLDLLPAGDASGAVGLRDGEALPIRFRIDQGALDGTTIQVSDGSGASGLAKSFTVAVSPAAPIEVEYWTDGETRWRLSHPAAVSHDVLLVRLLPGRAYHYRIQADASGLGAPTAEGTFTSDTLPTDLAEVVFQATGTPTAPLVMLEIRQPTFQGFVALDDQSRVVWHYRTTGSPWSWTRRANGNFVLQHVRLYARPWEPGTPDEDPESPWQRLPFASAQADFEQDVLGEYDLGATIRNVSPTALDVDWGYIDMSGTEFRIIDIPLTLVVDDSAALAA